jgi:F-type H+-transporting ATPase subunit gamma
MPNPRELRRRVQSVRSTAQITQTMQMVAASKMHKAQQSAINGMAYAQKLADLLADVTRHTGGYRHGVMVDRPVEYRGVVLIGSDRGLCGSLNNNLFRLAAQYDPQTTFFIAVGRKAAQFVQRTHRMLAGELAFGDPPNMGEARLICRFICQLYLDGDVDEVDILFNDFISTLKQIPTNAPFLPVGRQADIQSDPHDLTPHFSVQASNVDGGDAGELVFEPAVNVLYESLLLRSLDHQILQILRDSRASEHSARMVAMKSATDNAREMIDRLSLEYNKLRQGNITRELLEISSALAASG